MISPLQIRLLLGTGILGGGAYVAYRRHQARTGTGARAATDPALEQREATYMSPRTGFASGIGASWLGSGWVAPEQAGQVTPVPNSPEEINTLPPPNNLPLAPNANEIFTASEPTVKEEPIAQYTPNPGWEPTPGIVPQVVNEPVLQVPKQPYTYAPNPGWEPTPGIVPEIPNEPVPLVPKTLQHYTPNPGWEPTPGIVPDLGLVGAVQQQIKQVGTALPPPNRIDVPETVALRETMETTP